MCCQGRCRFRRQKDRPPGALRLRLGELKLSAKVHECATNGDRSGIAECYVSPLKPEDLAESHAGLKRETEERA
jgi:hypothetical protein